MGAEKGKLPGKTPFAGRRRLVTRKSGFKAAKGVTGGEFEMEAIQSVLLDKSNPVNITFEVPQKKGELSGFGLWFTSHKDVEVLVEENANLKISVRKSTYPNWGKIGSIWKAEESTNIKIEVTFTSQTKNDLAIYAPVSGTIKHKYLDLALSEKPALIPNMYQTAPESIFVQKAGKTSINGVPSSNYLNIYKKSCNRCARYLPINILNERAHLSFTNHCVAAHRRPCSHSGFGKLKENNGIGILNLDFGFQLECRFCKKFEVNAAHNPKRTAGQMKEDGARRRNIETLLTDLYGGSDQMRFRHENNGEELADYIWKKFDKKCFNCNAQISSSGEMDLDHTRPLALLWPLDKSATCLCGDCNTLKRDKPPVEFYTEEQLMKLSELTGLSMDELRNPNPNTKVLDLLHERLDWFFDVFLQKPELQREREGKVVAELLVKAIQKVSGALGSKYPNLIEEYKKRLKIKS